MSMKYEIRSLLKEEALGTKHYGYSKWEYETRESKREDRKYE